MGDNIEYKGFTIEISYDEDMDSDMLFGDDEYLFIVHDHRQFYVKRKGFEPADIYEAWSDGRKTYDGYWVFPLFAYIHAGVSLSLSRDRYPYNDRFDSSFAGFALAKRAGGWWKEDDAYKAAEALIKSWNDYLRGDVYYYNVEGVWSCGGYVGDEGYEALIADAKAEIDAHVSKQINKHLEKLKSNIRHKVPLEKRDPLEVGG